MKLIRLTSVNSNLFEINFNEDIIIPKGSQMGLKNISIKQFVPFLNVNALRDTVAVTVDQANVAGKEITLDHARYYNDNTDLYDFMTMFNDKLNVALTLTGRELGIEWLVSLIDSKVVIQYKMCNFDFLPVYYDFTSDVGLNIDSGQLSSSTRTTNQKDKYYSKHVFTKGSGVFRCRINKFVDNNAGSTGFEIGLSDVNPSSWEDSNTMTTAQRTFALIAEESDTNYKFINDSDSIQDSNIQPEKYAPETTPINDILEISISLGTIRGTIYQDSGIQQIFNFPIKSGIDLYPYIILYGKSDDIIIDDIKQCMSPYDDVVKADYPKFTNAQLYSHSSNPPPQQDTSSTITNITMPQFVGEYLGFSNPVLTQTANEVKFTGATEFTIHDASDDGMVILCDSLNLDSYDSDNKGRLNTLAVIPNLMSESRFIGYEPSTINFIDITNIADISLRNMRFRIVDKNIESVKLSNKAVMTILIKEPKD